MFGEYMFMHCLDSAHSTQPAQRRNIKASAGIGVTPSKRNYKSQNDQVERALSGQEQMVEILNKIYDQNNLILDEMRKIRQSMERDNKM